MSASRNILAHYKVLYYTAFIFIFLFSAWGLELSIWKEFKMTFDVALSVVVLFSLNL